MLPRNEWYKQLQHFVESVLEVVKLICVAVILLWVYIVLRIKGV
jgi:hypothetical protein